MSFASDLLPITPDGINLIPFVIVLILGLLTVLWLKSRRPSNYPPGPPSVPLLGSIPFLKYGGAEFYKEYDRLADKYGPIVSYALGHTWVMVLNDFEVIKEALVTKGTAFSGRINDPRTAALHKTLPIKGIIDGDYSPEWTKQRSVAMNILRSFGWGKHSIEEKMAEEREEMLKIFKESGGKPFKPSSTINTSVMNVICSMLFGKRFEHNNPILTHLITNLNVVVAASSADYEYGYIPLLSSLIPGVKHYMEKIKKAWRNISNYIEDEIKIRREQQAKNPGDDPKDFLEGYLKELGEASAKKTGKISQDWLLDIGGDFFAAGSETTTTTLKWALLFMLHFPDVQKKVQDELDNVVGKPTGEGIVTLADRSRLPYTDATIMEIQRLSGIVATALPHCTTTDVEIRGYHIPKGTEVRYNLYSVLHDPSYWSDPQTLKPERFLDDEGKVQKDERWIPFGMGRRNCLGEQLARQELFIFFTGIVHCFNVRLPEGAALPSLEPAVHGVILVPEQCEVILEPRF